MSRIFLLVIIIFQIIALTTFGAFAAKHALVIGNSSYDELTDLQNTHSDAEAYHATFIKLGYNSTLKRDLTYDATWNVLDQLLDKVRPGDQVAFVYSGHGWSDGLNNFISPIDSRLSGSDRQLKRNSIPLSNGQSGILDELRATGASLTFAVIDACRNNPFLPLPGKKSAGMSRGLARIDNQQGSFVVFSAGAGQEALDRMPSDDKNQKLSVFSRHFIPKLESNMYLEDAISAAQVETQTLALTYNGHKQLPIYEDGTAGKTCLSDNCSLSIQANLPEKDIQASAQGSSFVPQEQLMAQNLSVQQCDQAAGSIYHPDYTQGLMIATPPKFDEIDASFGIKACKNALKNFPDHPRMLANLANAYHKRGHEHNDSGFDGARNDSFTKSNEILSTLSLAGDNFGQILDGHFHNYGHGIDEDDQKAIDLLLIHAEDGNAFAQMELAEIYFSNNYEKSLHWLRKAAEQDHDLALMGLAHMYQTGKGVEKNLTKSLEFFHKSAQLGNVHAVNAIGFFHKNGLGVPVDKKEAFIWFQKAANLGDEVGQYNLAQAYYNGHGVIEDKLAAAKWHEKAADQGYSGSLNDLGIMYAGGEGVQKNPEKAARLLVSSVREGSRTAINARLTVETNKEIQRILREDGLYTGAIDGKKGPGTKAAMQKLLPN